MESGSKRRKVVQWSEVTVRGERNRDGHEVAKSEQAFYVLPLVVELVEANGFLFPLLIGGGERVAIINTINKRCDKTLLEVMDKESSVSFFVVTSLSDGGIETNEEIFCRL